MHLRRILLSISLVAIAAGIAYSAAVTGKISDSKGEPMIEATVRLLSARDSSLIKITTADKLGRYSFTDVKSAKYILQTSYVGYATQCRNITVKTASLTVDPIVLQESSIMLKEATVVGIKTPIKVMEDTVEYNADSYKTQPNAVVEDLLKRLPGVEVDNEGKITANGKEVSKILVDGRDFFSDDPTVASRNLPVDMVDKLQVVDRKSDLARLTGVDDGEDETVINLTVKKGMKNGWFGTVEGGYGTDDRYKASFNVNRFWNDNQMTFLGNFNNVNELGFTDSNGNRFRRFGDSNGINVSQSIGMNFNVGNGEIFRVGGDIMYSHSDRDTRQQQDRQYLFTDSTSYEESAKNARDRGHNIRGDFRLQWNPDSFNVLEFRPNFSVNINDSESMDSSLTSAGDALRSMVNRSLNTENSHGTSLELGGELIYSHKFRSKPGRSYSLHFRYNMSNVKEKSNSYSFNRFYLLNDSIDLYDQYADNHTWSNSIQARATWTEPLGDVKNGRFLTFSYNMQYRWNNADKLTYDHPVSIDSEGNPVVDYSQLDFNEDLSNSFRNNYFSQDIRLGFKQVRSAYSVDAGLSFVPTMSSSHDLINSARDIATRWVWNFAPFLRYRYKMGRSRSLNVNYTGRSSQPSMTQLQPVADMSDPLRIVVGNPDLKPSFSHNIRLRFQDFNADAQRAIMAMADITATQNSIISKSTYDSTTGGQTTTYTNVNGVWNARLMNLLSMTLGNKAWTMTTNIMASYRYSVGFNNDERNRSGSFSVGESFGIAWRPDNIELELRPRYNLQTVHNSVQRSANSTVHTYGGTFNGTYYAPLGFVFATDVTYSATNGYSQGYDTNQWLVNASISYQFLAGKAATVSVKVYDLLKQKSNVSRNITANYFDDTMYNSLTRYFMVSFTYRFSSFGKGQKPDQEDFMRDGPPEGPGGR